MTKLDLKDAYFTIPIQSSIRQALRFSIQDPLYQFTCLPFGLSCAPWFFTKTLNPAITLLNELGVRLVAYIDDILTLAETEEMARNHTEGLTYLLENLRFIIDSEKTVTTPTQEIEFLGMVVDSRTMELKLPGHKIRKLRQEATKIIKD
uniref:Reverse transcriptase domain-containing protein n=1 Tax=Amphimedon queenslandica TaxID=400682 RepID=A0A1X7TB14_AMPQE